MNIKDKSDKFILQFSEVGIEDVPLVGGKNAALGEMYRNLTSRGVNVPNGFAITAYAYRYFLEKLGLDEKIKSILTGLDTHNILDLQKRGMEVRSAILSSKLPRELEEVIIGAYKKLSEECVGGADAVAEDGTRGLRARGFIKRAVFDGISVAVRSSATAEDLPGASFAGQQETYLNVVGKREVLQAVKKCIASLFTNRAISYRTDKGFSLFDVALSVGVQEMIRSDKASSGVAFTIDTESGFDKVVVINGIYGLGEFIVQGKVVPDEFIVFKPSLEKGLNAIIAKNLGRKNIKLVYGLIGTKKKAVPKKDEEKFCLTENEVLLLAKWCVEIEKYFSEKYGRYQPMDIEWAKDGKTGKLFIVQARPETVHSVGDGKIYREYRLKERGDVLASGIAVGSRIGSGPVRVIKNVRGISLFKKGEVLVTEITDPDWEPIMKIASAIVTDKGGRTSHAAIVSRELGIPCIVGTGNATARLKDGEEVTIDCASGEVGKAYAGKLPFEVEEHDIGKVPEIKTKIMVNIGSPDEAFRYHYLPAKGVGLGRLEFIIASHIGIHPKALLEYKKLKFEARSAKFETDSKFKISKQNLKKIKEEIEKKTVGYEDKAQFYIDELAEGIAKIGAVFWPNEVIIRFSDFKTNEYRKLIGGELYEPEEENPMLGWRGASRYYDPKFKDAFGLECKALKKVRDEMGLLNVVAMIPFCRTPEEGRKVLEIMEEYGLSRESTRTKKQISDGQVGVNQSSNPRESAPLKVYVMCEIPSNILLADEFLKIFDGMSIGSNDLTQLTLGLDRDSGIVTHIANEKDPSVKKLISEIIKKCRKKGKYIGICGQAPSDYPDFAEFLVEEGIDSMSLNPDTVIKTILLVAKKEKGEK